MKNKFLFFLFFLLVSKMFFLSVNSAEQFNFDVTEIEVLQNGNVIKGIKKGSIKTDDGIIINADNFVYEKLLNILTADGKVEIIDTIKNLKIYSDSAIYDKNNEIITTDKNSKAIYEKGKFITGNTFRLNRNENILNANGKVEIQDTIKDYLISGDNFTYYKEYEKIITKGKTDAFLQSKYKISSSDVIFLIKENILSSSKKTKIEDNNSQVYFAENFRYSINEEIFKGEKILIITNYNLPKSDKFYFKNAIINLKEQKFIAKDTEIKIHKDIFDNTENDPRLKGVSSLSDNNLTIINKGVFTSCKKTDKCPPWAISAKVIKHDKTKKQLIYDNALLKVYDFPVFYFPKFFHPDPSVKRQSGLLKPQINNSNALGSSLTLPYFKVISENKDLTLTPILFDNTTSMLTTEYREERKNSKILADFGYVDGYKSITTNKKNSLSHLFFNLDHNLNLKNFNSSDFKLKLNKVSKDTYLKVFDQHITKSTLRPDNFDKLNSSLIISLDHTDFNLTSGIDVYEDLQTKKNSDRYQYNLPYYNFDKLISENFFNGNLNFSSSGSNYLKDTNKLETKITNDFIYNSLDFISNLGIKNNYSLSLKNLNSVGKHSSKYKSNPQVEIAGLFNVDLSMPLEKKDENYDNLLTPKLSFRFNPSDMKDHSLSDNKINVGSAFALNRLGLSDTLEAGRSITLGLDYKNEKKII